MKLKNAVATYRRLRDEPLWRLLAADSAPAVIALLQNDLSEGHRKVSASILYERLARDIEERPLASQIRLRILDSSLRDCVGGLGDIAAPVGEVATLVRRS